MEQLEVKQVLSGWGGLRGWRRGLACVGHGDGNREDKRQVPVPLDSWSCAPEDASHLDHKDNGNHPGSHRPSAQNCEVLLPFSSEKEMTTHSGTLA